MLILLADDHVVVRCGLREILANAFAGAQFVEAGVADEVLSAIQHHSCSLLVLDVNMPGRSGIDLLHDIKTLRPKLPGY